MKMLLAAAAVLGFAGLAACSPAADSAATNAEEIGERVDTANEQATTGTTDMSDGPLENAGEAIDAANREAGANVPVDAPPPLDHPPKE